MSNGSPRSGGSPPSGDPPEKSKVIDVTKRPRPMNKNDDFSMTTDIGPHSPWWLDFIRPFTSYIFILLTLVIMTPFFFAAWGDPSFTGENILDWAKMVFPPVVGFTSAAVGYMFGTRTANNDETRNNREDV